MSIQSALAFIHQVRDDEAVQRRIELSDREVDPEALVAIGSEIGFVFTLEELRSAHRHDWSMRWLHNTSRRAG